MSNTTWKVLVGSTQYAVLQGLPWRSTIMLRLREPEQPRVPLPPTKQVRRVRSSGCACRPQSAGIHASQSIKRIRDHATKGQEPSAVTHLCTCRVKAL